jgi:8-oxo-dGTP pyrophosphatase MutT (NUDIX family)
MNIDDFPLLTEWPKCDLSVVGVVIQDDLQRVGVQLRDDFPHVASGGFWGFFGGHVDPGEAVPDTALRELNEETGISAMLDDFEPFARLVPPNGLQAYHYYYRFKRIVSVADVTVGEGAGLAFINYRQTQRFEFIESASLILEYLHERNEFAL